MTATQHLKQWQRSEPGRKVPFGVAVAAMADGECSVCAAGADAETAARLVLEAWYFWCPALRD